MKVICNLIRKLYRKRQDYLISNYHKALNSLNSTTPSLLELKNIQRALVLAPHPDDEAIGCGGALFQLAQKGCYGETIFFTNGRKNNSDDNLKITAVRQQEALQSAKILGMGKCHFMDCYDDNIKSDKETVDFLLERLEEFKPDIVFSPFFLENHPDHNKTAKILALASDKYSGDFVCYCYELWSALIPNYIVDISSIMDKKIASIESHKSQLAETDFVDLAKGLNRYRAITSGQPIQYAEAFFVVTKEKFIKISKQF